MSEENRPVMPSDIPVLPDAVSGTQDQGMDDAPPAARHLARTPSFFGAELIDATPADDALVLPAEAEPAAEDDGAPLAQAVPTATARIAAYARDKVVAFAPHATQEFVENPQWMAVPGGAYYAYGLLHWQGRHIPFIHLESLLLAYPAFDDKAAVPYALVLAYQTAPHAPLQYGAIAVTEIPHSKTVADADFAPLPEDSDMWADLAISCFRQNGKTYPILDAAKIFGRYHG